MAKRSPSLNLGLCAAAVLIALLFAPSARTQTDEASSLTGIAPGDSAVSGFSGTVLSSPSLAPGVDPLDKTVIDVDGASLRVYDLSTLGGAPAGQLVSPPVKFSVPAKDIGQVFSLVFDTQTDPPNLYAGATSAYGIQIVSTQLDEDGSPVRVRNGAPDARFMDGQFGGLPGAGPGTIYKIDGKTGKATALADLGLAGVANSGPGVGGLAFDPKSRTLYASDLDDGLIHRFALDQNAADLGQFDHGQNGRPSRELSPVQDDGKRMDITKPTFKPDSISTYGFTQAERRVRALAVHDGRLYYAVDEGPEIWSVALNPDGSFIPEDVRWELLVKADRKLPVASIVFDGEGRMILAQRGTLKSAYDYGAFVEPGGAQVLRYAKEDPDDPATPSIWAPEPQSYAIGFSEANKSASGGVAMQYGYRPDGGIDLDSCYGTIAATADGLTGDGAGHGLQLNGAALVLPADDPLRKSAFVEFDGRQNKANLIGHVGGVAVSHACAGEGAPQVGAPGYPPVGGGGGFPPVGGGGGFPPIGAFPPVEGEVAPVGEPPVLDTPTPGGQADAAGSNLAVVKSQSCKLLAADKAECLYTVALSNTGKAPFETNGLNMEDRFSVPPASFDTDGFGTPTKTADGFKTVPGSPGTVTIAPGPASFSQTIKASFNVPAGGLTVENCIFLTPTAAGIPLTPRFVPVETLPDPDLPASTSDALDHAIAITGTPQCAARGDVRDCSWTVKLSNPSLQAANQSFEFKTSKPAVGIGGPSGLSVRRKDETTTVFTSGAGPLRPKSAKSFTVKATFPLDPADPISATASLVSPPAQDVNAANNTASADAGTAPPEIIPSPGVTSADANPDDNTSCIKWDSTKPDDQGTPTNAPAPPAQPPQTEADGLDIKKAAVPGSCRNNRSCEFNVTITNVGTTTFQGSVEFDDTVTGDGAFFGATAINKEPALPWSCKKDGQSFKCAIADLTLAPNGSTTVLIGFDLGPGVGAVKEMKNCAKLKDAKDAACATIPLASPLQLTKTASVASCTNEGGCAFEINIKNAGPVDLPGPITITETVTVNGVFVATMSPTFPPPWGCTNIAPTFRCTHDPANPNGIPAGASLTLPISFKIGSPTAEPATIKNCVAIEGSPETVCAEIPVIMPPPPKADLTIQNVAIAPTCPLSGPCLFKIDISNAGAQPYNGGLSFSSTIWSGAAGTTSGRARYEISSPSGPWVCAPTSQAGSLSVWKCQLPTLTGGTGALAGLTFSIRPSVEKSNDGSVTSSSEWSKDNILTLCAQLGRDPAGNDNIELNKPKEQCASVRLDPFAVEIKKSGAQSCSPGGECRFDLEIFNPGPILHDDPVTVTDNLTGIGSAPIVSIVPAAGAKPFPCAPAPAQIPFSCSGHMRLEINERHKYVMTVKLPPDAPANGSFKNCASIASGAVAPGDRSPTRATATGASPPPQNESCHEVTLAPACTGGMVLNEDGRCACPVGQTWDGNACTVEEKTCPAGTTGTPPNCEAPSSSSGADTSKTPPSDTTPGKSGAPAGCDVEACAAAYKSFRASDCTFGTGGGKRQRCNAKSGGSAGSDTSKSPATCPPNRPVGKPPNCCPKGMEFKRGACRCAEGTELKGGVCVAIQKAPAKCPPGTELRNGACLRAACPPGTVGVPPFCNQKKQDAPPPKEKKPRDQSGQGPAKCPSDRPVGTPPNCCPSGTQFRKGGCYPLKCTPGWTGVPPDCQPPQSKKSPPPFVPLRECKAPKTGIFPNCRCPAGTEEPDCTPPFRTPR
jgi:hypothetical protein